MINEKNKRLSLRTLYNKVKKHKYRLNSAKSYQQDYFRLLYDVVQKFYIEMGDLYPKACSFGHEWNTLLGNQMFEPDEEQIHPLLLEVDKQERIQSEIILGMIHCFLDKSSFNIQMPRYNRTKIPKGEKLGQYYSDTYTTLNPITYNFGRAIYQDNKWSFKYERSKKN